VADSVSSPRRAGRQRQRRGGWASVARRRSVSGLWRLAGPAAPPPPPPSSRKRRAPVRP